MTTARSRAFALAAVLVLAAGYAFVAPMAEDGLEIVALRFLFAGGVAAFVVGAARGRRLDAVAGPASLMALVAGGLFSLGPAVVFALVPRAAFLYMHGGYGPRLDESELYLGSVAEGMVLGFALACLGVAVLVSAVPRRPATSAVGPVWPALVAAVVFGAGAWTARHVAALPGGLGEVATVAALASATWAAVAAEGRPVARWTAAAVAMGFAIVLLNSLIALFFIVALCGRLMSAGALTGRRAAFTALGAGAMIAAALVVAWIGFGQRYPPPAAKRAPSVVVDRIVYPLAAKLLMRQTITGYCLRQLVDKTRETPGDRPLYFAAAIVPRAVWPDKPSLSTGNEVAYRYCGHTKTQAAKGSMAVTVLGQPIEQGGAVGLAVAVAVALALLAGASLAVAAGPGWAVVGVLVATPWLINFEQHFALYLATSVKFGLVAAATGGAWSWLAGRRAASR